MALLNSHIIFGVDTGGKDVTVIQRWDVIKNNDYNRDGTVYDVIFMNHQGVWDLALILHPRLLTTYTFVG